MTDLERATEALTRVGVAAQRLGIDTQWLQAATKHLGDAPARYLRTWLDTETPGLALRCESSVALARRPGGVRFVEVDSDGRVYELAVGTRRFADDRALIELVPAPALDGIERILDLIGRGRCDALGRIDKPLDSPRPASAARESLWTVSLVEVAGEDLPMSAAKLGAHAHRLGVPPPHTALLQQVHVALGGKGYTVTFTCDRTGVGRNITLEYQDIAWKHVIGLTDAVRPGTSSAKQLGTFAGAMNAGDSASGVAITYRAGKPAQVRVAIDRIQTSETD